MLEIRCRLRTTAWCDHTLPLWEMRVHRPVQLALLALVEDCVVVPVGQALQLVALE
jgi:hypothetical protein